MLAGCRGPADPAIAPPPLPPIDARLLAQPAAKRFDEMYRAVRAARTRQDLVDSLGALAELAYASGLWELAGACYDALCELQPESYLRHHMAAVVVLEAGDTEKATRLLRKTLELAPSDEGALLYLADLRIEAGDFTEAQHLLERSLGTGSRSAYALTRLGRIAELLGEPERSLERYRSALEMEPEADAIHASISRVHRRLGDTGSADRHLQMAGTRTPLLADPVAADVRDRAFPPGSAPMIRRGSAALKFGDLETAVDSFTTALEIDPDDVEANELMGRTLARLGEVDAALNHYRAAIEAQPNDPWLHFDFGSRLGTAGRWMEAAEELRVAATLAPTFREAHRNLGVALANLERWNEAADSFAAAVALEPRDEETRFLWATVLDETGATDAAERELRAVLERDARHPGALRRLAEIQHRGGRTAEALGLLQRAVELHPTDSLAWSSLGLVLERSARLDEAEAAYRKVVELDPANADAARAAARLRRELGRRNGG